MESNPKYLLNLPLICWQAWAVSVGVLIVCLAFKALFSEDISMSVMDAQLDITNSRLALTRDASEVARLGNNTEKLLSEAKNVNERVKEANKSLRLCQTQLEKHLPNYEEFPLELPEIVEPIPEHNFVKAEQQLEETQQSLEEQISKMFN